ncbi:hypothetical protein [Lichenihabitans psoromatis]|uniref:hypothetical protein n=1 Tax=Lichenihabitans psoromatis TaxID=2528642 RepID=UPI0010385B77|nr:hypothetical protein [Lichenihabitans psoromatis]
MIRALRLYSHAILISVLLVGLLMDECKAASPSEYNIEATNNHSDQIDTATNGIRLPASDQACGDPRGRVYGLCSRLTLLTAAEDIGANLDAKAQQPDRHTVVNTTRIVGSVAVTGGAYGESTEVTNQGRLAGHGDAFRCFSYANAGAFELCRSAMMWDLANSHPVNTQYQSFWSVNVSPRDTVGSWATTDGELNVTNRGDDLGFVPDLTKTLRFTGGLRFVPESQNFSPPDGSPNWSDYRGTANNVTFAYAVGHSSLHNSAGKQIKTYVPYLVEPDSVGPSGRAFFATGDTKGSEAAQRPYSPFQAQGAWQNGLDTSAANFDDKTALLMAPSQSLRWSKGTVSAGLTGECSGTVCELYAKASAILPSGFTMLGSSSLPFSGEYLKSGSSLTWVDDKGKASVQGVCIDSKCRLYLTAMSIAPIGSGSLGEEASPFDALILAANGKAILPFFTPASSTAPCKRGQVADDAEFHYVCVGESIWKRAALSSF